MNTRELTCIVCPRGCQLTAVLNDDGSVTVKGNTCKRGEEYAKAELTHPVRTLTTTVRTADGSVLPVRTAQPIPKELVFEAMKAVNALVLDRPVTFGDVVIADILGTGVDLIAAGIWNNVK